MHTHSVLQQFLACQVVNLGVIPILSPFDMQVLVCTLPKVNDWITGRDFPNATGKFFQITPKVSYRVSALSKASKSLTLDLPEICWGAIIK